MIVDNVDVRVVPDVLRDMVNIYVVNKAHTYAALFSYSGRVEWVPYPEGDEPPVTLRLPPNVLAAIVAEAAELRPPTQATVEHLNDARAVRDRLLALVERLT